MAKTYVHTGGNANNSGSTDTNSPTYSITVHATYGGGATIPIQESHDLSVLNLSGENQDSVNFTDASNTNQDIFWITAVNNAASPKTITVSVAPTGLTAGTSVGNIGGRILFSGVTGEENSFRAGDEIIIKDTPAAQAGTYFTCRVNGSLTAGFVKIRGETGVKPVLNCTGNVPVIDMNSIDYQWIENLELDSDGSTANVLNNTGAGSVIYNVKIVDGGNHGIDVNEDGLRVVGCEVTGCGGDALNSLGFTFVQIVGCYFHGNTGHGWASSATTPRSATIDSVYASNGGSGINLTGAPASATSCMIIYGCTFYANATHGISASDADFVALMINNIFLDNGTTGTEYNVNWPASFHFSNFSDFNIFNQGGGLGGNNFNNYTAQAHDLTSAPDINTSTFLPSSTSPAKAAGFAGGIPVTSPTLTGYKDIGAMQRQEPSGGGGGGGMITHPGMSGGLNA